MATGHLPTIQVALSTSVFSPRPILTLSGTACLWGRLEEEEWREGDALDDYPEDFPEQVWICQRGEGQEPGLTLPSLSRC